MTNVRKLASKILAFVVRHASPGSKEWAEGLSREAAFIENDWSALSWALGGTRVLLDRREIPIASLDDAYAMGVTFIESRQKHAGIWIAYLIQTLASVILFFQTKILVQHVGCCVAVLGSLILGAYWLFERRRLDALLKHHVEDELLFYKTELERSLRPLPEFWITTLGLLFYLTGVVLALPLGIMGRLVWSAFLVGAFLVVMLTVLQTRHARQRRLQRLEELLAKK